MSKLTDYLAKMQSTDDRDRLAKERREIMTKAGHSLHGVIADQHVCIGYDSRTADIIRLCEIVKLQEGLIIKFSITQLEPKIIAEYREQIDQLIEGSEG